MQIQALFLVLCGVLCVKGTPFYPDSSVDLLKFHEVNGQHESNPQNNTLQALKQNVTVEIVSEQENTQSIDMSEISEESLESEEEFEKHHPGHAHGHGPNHGPHHVPGNNHEHGQVEIAGQLGPVELSLRNLVSASAIATEELFLEVVASSSQTSKMFKTKSELLTSHAMNAIFRPLNMVETEIKKSQECGRQFVDSFNSILSQVNSGLNTCVYNLTLVADGFRNQSTQILVSISKVADDIKNLPESCELGRSLTLGTFCIVNNLAEANERVVMSMKDFNFYSTIAKEYLSKATESSVACQKNLVEAATKKLEQLSNVVLQKCSEQLEIQNNEI